MSTLANVVEIPCHLAMGPKGPHEKGANGSLRLFKSGDRYVAMLTVMLPRGPLVMTATADASLLGPMAQNVAIAGVQAQANALPAVPTQPARPANKKALAAAHLYTRILQKDRTAIAAGRYICEAAKAGEPSAALAYQYLKAAHERANTKGWRMDSDKRVTSARKLYYRALSGDASAKEALKTLRDQAKAGNQTAKEGWDLVQAVHAEAKASGTSTGAATVPKLLTKAQVDKLMTLAHAARVARPALGAARVSGLYLTA